MELASCILEQCKCVPAFQENGYCDARVQSKVGTASLSKPCKYKVEKLTISFLLFSQYGLSLHNVARTINNLRRYPRLTLAYVLLSCRQYPQQGTLVIKRMHLQMPYIPRQLQHGLKSTAPIYSLAEADKNIVRICVEL